jgi:hypothetical protein
MVSWEAYMPDRWPSTLERLFQSRTGRALCLAWVIALAATLAW